MLSYVLKTIFFQIPFYLLLIIISTGKINIYPKNPSLNGIVLKTNLFVISK